jgi:hypothetical protein
MEPIRTPATTRPTSRLEPVRATELEQAGNEHPYRAESGKTSTLLSQGPPLNGGSRRHKGKMLNSRLPVPLIAVCHFRPREAIYDCECRYRRGRSLRRQPRRCPGSAGRSLAAAERANHRATSASDTWARSRQPGAPMPGVSTPPRARTQPAIRDRRSRRSATAPPFGPPVLSRSLGA